MAKTSMTRTVYSSTNSPSINPITSMGTPVHISRLKRLPIRCPRWIISGSAW
jgi:hypothetical protein